MAWAWAAKKELVSIGNNVMADSAAAWRSHHWTYVSAARRARIIANSHCLNIQCRGARPSRGVSLCVSGMLARSRQTETRQKVARGTYLSTSKTHQPSVPFFGAIGFFVLGRTHVAARCCLQAEEGRRHDLPTPASNMNEVNRWALGALVVLKI